VVRRGDNYVKVTELAPGVLELIDTRSSRGMDGGLKYSRQRVARFCSRNSGTRVGGYSLTHIMLGPPAKQVAHYKVSKETAGAE
jgi:hypothetical protein